jgi:site-specific DNA-methyltransferase (adenine-specific)
MDIEKLKLEAQNKALHIADVSGSALFNADCMDILPLIPDKSVQLILADLPYGTTACKWDTIIPFDKLWEQYERIITDNGAIVLTAQQPFTSALIMSNVKLFRYCWYWEKERLTNIAQVKKRAGKTVEEVVVFYKKQPTYNPQFVKYNGKPRTNKVKNGVMGKLTDSSTKKVIEYKDNGLRYPTQVLKIQRDILKSNLHPTQKPLELMKYMILTYSNENDIVLDNTMGIGTTCLGAKELNRSFIGIEKEVKYYELAVGRVFGQHCH